VIYALEGPDCCGKSTVVEMLRNLLPAKVKIVPTMPMSGKIWSVIEDVEQRQEALWWYLHDDSATYVCDRHVVISSAVYGRLYNRPTWVDTARWRSKIAPIYLAVPLSELKRRYRARKDSYFDDSNYSKLMELYASVLNEFPAGEHLDGTGDPAVVASRVAAVIWKKEAFPDVPGQEMRPRGRE
jgi:thymidylate kinase